MKKTVKINIGGVFFNIDEDAYQILQNYLAHINRKFSAEPEGKEIISDIESRIAEILQSKISTHKQVISKEDIDEIIDIMGRPEDFDNENTQQNSFSYSRRMYRDPDNRILGGVCSGMAAYFNIDPVIIRVIFVVLLFAWGVAGVIYIVLWALLPPAYTTAEKLHMRGENMTIADIEKNIKNEFEYVKSSVHNYKNSRNYDQTRSFLNEFFSVIGQIIMVFFKIIGGIIGFTMIIVGLALLIGLAGWVIIGEPFMPWNNIFIDNQLVYTDMINTFLNPGTIWLFSVSLFLIIFIPLVSLVYAGLKLLLRFKINDKPFAIIGFSLWFLSVIAVILLSFTQVRNLSVSARSVENINIQRTTNSPIYFDVEKIENAKSSKFYIFDGEFSVTYDKNDKKSFYVHPEIDIHRSVNQLATIEIEKTGRGLDYLKAEENTQKIRYNCKQTDSLIKFDAYYPLLKENVWAFPEVDVTINIPDSTIIFISENMVEQLDYIETTEYMPNRDLGGKYWIMTEKGLTEYKINTIGSDKKQVN
jgi:phage shock protein PspC (stress-responsive transcriptional regulator)